MLILLGLASNRCFPQYDLEMTLRLHVAMLTSLFRSRLFILPLAVASAFSLSHAETANPKTKATTPASPAKKAQVKVIPADINGYKTVVAPPPNPASLKIAIFDGDGAPKGGVDSVCERVKSMPGSTITLVKAEQIAAGGLAGYDVVIFSGGSGSTQAKALGDDGRKKVREFVKNGGGYVGICAGAYLACSNFSWGLGILNASTVSSKWMRGSGYMDVEVTVDGAPIIGPVDGIFKVRYNNGPIIKPGDRADLPAYRPLSLFRSEVAKNDTPVGIMVNSPAQAVSTFGKGRVFISSPHPENTPGLEHLIPRGILWAAGKLEEHPATTAVP
jgi:putative intracellular protease/amidase